MRKYCWSISICLMSLAFFGPARAQISKGGTPYSFRQPATPLLKANIAAKTMARIDVESLLVEDSLDETRGDVPFRFGFPFDVQYSLDNSGTWDDLPDGGRLWRLRIECPGAYTINLIYDDLWLPPGAELFLYNETRDMVIGAFTEANNKPHRQFATQPVKGNVTILEYYEPSPVQGEGKISISRVVHGYKDIFKYYEKGFGSSGTCNNNINCPEGEPWQKEKRSVAMVLLAGGTRWCSGALVNNERQDETPYFLTANHCLGGEATWIFMFNYESPTCTNEDGPTYMTLNGSTLRASSAQSDFALLEISEAPPGSYHIYYAGWSNVDTPSPRSVAIHHPDGDVKKISFDDDSLTSTEYLQTVPGETHWRIGQWEDGTTEGGSSGSPLFGHEHHVIGQLHGGTASCASITSDWYGKFAHSWDGGGTPASQLRVWLDPDYTGISSLTGYDPDAGINIKHMALEDTWDESTTFPVLSRITAAAGVNTGQLRLEYSNGSGWISQPLLATGQPDEYAGEIPAQPAGTRVEYYVAAEDLLGGRDSTVVFDFLVNYTSAALVYPDSFIETIGIGNSADRQLILESTGNGNLTYNIRVFTTPSNQASSFDQQPFPSDKNAGGPDQFGHIWIDSDDSGGPTFDWIDIASTGTNIRASLGDDNYSGPYPIGFDFSFYGNDYSDFFVGSNGLIGFGSTGMSEYHNQPVPTADNPNNMLAWLWDDLNIDDGDNPGAGVYYQTRGDSLIVEFVSYPEYGAAPGDVVTAEVILTADGVITYQYLNIAPGFMVGECVVGMENAGGTDGLEVAFYEPYLKNDLAIQFLTVRQWLTVDQSSGNIPPGSADTIVCHFSTDSLEPGTYYADIIIGTNETDPAFRTRIIPAELTVTPGYKCGDANGDGRADIGDAVFLINYIFKGGAEPSPMGAGDPNCDLRPDVGDVVYLINYIFKGGPEPCCPDLSQ